MSEGTPIRDLPEWPADQPLPADAVAVVGAATAEEAREYLRRLREAEELRLRDLEAAQRRQQERYAAEAKQRAEVLAGLARLGRGELQVGNPRQRNPGGGRKPDELALRVAAVAHSLVLQYEREGERLGMQEAINTAAGPDNLDVQGFSNSAALKRLRQFLAE